MPATERLFCDDERVEKLVGELRKVTAWVARDDDYEFARECLADFPTLDLVVEARSWKAWMDDHQTKKRVRPRSRFRTWCGNAVRWANPTRRDPGRNDRGSGGAVPRASADSARDYGPDTDIARW